jgi:NAD(P)-dependent dehydrogenase (short-subunit alcohol dehydrogenase family)
MERNTKENKNAIVTGGSRGFGRALAGALVQQGWRVFIDGRDEAAVAAAAGLTGAVGIPGDVADPSHREDLVGAAAGAGGHLDLLVNNASALGPSPLPGLRDFPLGQLRLVFEVNVLAPLALAQLALPSLERSTGALVNVTSDAAVEAYPGWGGYGASKAALEQWSNVLAVEEAAVRVWWLDPGDMRTDMHQAAFPGEDISDRPEPATIVPAVLRLLRERPPSGRVKASELVVGAAVAP